MCKRTAYLVTHIVFSRGMLLAEFEVWDHVGIVGKVQGKISTL